VEAAKDVSNAGILGTISMMIENSGKGAIIELSSIPKPAEIELPDWLICFQSFGFILSVSPKHSETVVDLFQEGEITTAVIGKVTDSSVVILKNGPESKVLFDTSTTPNPGLQDGVKSAAQYQP
jgi:selenophosphate synthetase-related protein